MRSRFPFLAAGTAAAISLAACASPVASGGGGATGGASQEVKGGKILIAQSSPESGPGAAAAAYTAGVRAYLEYLNDQGGIGGYTFDVRIVDNQGNAAGGAQAIRQILENKPFAVVIDGSASFQASVDIIKAQSPNLPTVGLGNAQLIHDSGLTNAFGLFANYTQECYMQVDFALHNLGLKKLALVYEDSPTGQGPAAKCPAYAQKEGAQEFKSYAVPPPAVSTNYGPIAAQIDQQKPELALFFGSNGEMVGLQKAAYAIGSTTKWIGFAPSYDITYYQLAGPAAVGTYFDAFAEPVNSETPEAKLFRDEMAKRAANAANSAGGYGWSYGAIIQKAVEAALKANNGTLTQEVFVTAMRGLTLGQTGLLYSVDYTKDTSQVTSKMNIYQVTQSGLNQVGKDLALPAG